MAKILVGGYSGDKGAGSGVSVVQDGEVVATIPAESPSWIAKHPSLPVLYAVAETADGRVQAWSLVDGQPAEPVGSAETCGAEPAHLAVDRSGRFLMTANYTGGSISVHRLGADGSIGERTDMVQHTEHGDHPRQQSAHPHMVAVTGESVLVIDLGADLIYRYRLTDEGRLELQQTFGAPAGSGPRHARRVGRRYYVTAELSGDVLVYDERGTLLTTLPASKSLRQNQPSELLADDDGRYLYIANRGPNTVSVFSLDADFPRFVAEVPVGDWPRHLALDGDLLYVANERSHEVMVMRIDPVTGIPAVETTIAVPSPTCVVP
jgi:6-phosphogluconolactonase